MVNGIESVFPGLRGTDYRVSSPHDEVYNCIAWAAGDTRNWWWPGEPKVTHWPDGVPRVRTLEAFRDAFATLGYEPCASGECEPGFEKVALYATADGLPQHAARQLSDGRWTSKLGMAEDIEHHFHDLEGKVYGSVVLVMRRPRPTATDSAAQTQSKPQA